MRRVTAVRHIAFEDLGVLEPLLRERGFEVRYLDVADVAAADPGTADSGVADVAAADLAAAFAADLVVVLGAPVGVYDARRYPFLAAELGALRRRLAGGAPTLGICLGAQLMAHALGAAVENTGRVEIGYAPLDLTDAGGRSPLRHTRDVPVLHWHGDQFTVPADARRLAQTPGFPNQAFDLGPSVLGLQFHLEADHRRIERWLIGHAHELAAAGVDPRVVRADAERHGPRLAAAAIEVFSDWLDGLPAR